jgi:hypothetical protein
MFSILAGFVILTIIIMGIVQGSVFICTLATLVIGAIMLLIHGAGGPAVTTWEWVLGLSLIVVWGKTFARWHDDAYDAGYRAPPGGLIGAICHRADTQRPPTKAEFDEMLLKEAEARVAQRQAAETKRLMADLGYSPPTP